MISTDGHVSTFENDHLHPEPHGVINRIFSSFLSSSVRLAQQSLSVLPWLIHKSTPFCSMQVHDVSVFDECHFDIIDSVNGAHPHNLNEGCHFEVWHNVRMPNK